MIDLDDDLPPPEEPTAQPEVVALPHDRDAERAVLGACLAYDGVFDQVRGRLQARDFYVPAHIQVWLALTRLAERGIPATVIEAVRADLEAAGVQAVPQLLFDLVDGTPRNTNVRHYAGRVLERARRRRAIEDGQRLIDAAANGSTTEDLECAIELMRSRWARSGPERSYESAVLHSPGLEPIYPSWRVTRLLPEFGLALMWAHPGAGKTTWLLRLMHQLCMAAPPESIDGHPDLRVAKPCRRVLWLATEESAGELQALAEPCLRGLGDPQLAGSIEHIFAAADGKPVTTDDLPDLVARYADADIVILDSLTGLRPAMQAGQRIKWDLDNDAASALLQPLRGLAARRNVLFLIVHHTGREVEKGYRGPMEYWARVDSMWGLVPDETTQTIKVKPQKLRKGKRLCEFRLRSEWDEDAYRFTYDGAIVNEPESTSEHSVVAFMRGVGMASQREIVSAMAEQKITRTTARRAIDQLLGKGILRATGDAEGGSPIYRFEVTE